MALDMTPPAPASKKAISSLNHGGSLRPRFVHPCVNLPEALAVAKENVEDVMPSGKKMRSSTKDVYD